MVSIKILSSTAVFKSLFLEHQISILELFLKDHVTLKTGVMAAENSAVITSINLILQCTKI